MMNRKLAKCLISYASIFALLISIFSTVAFNVEAGNIFDPGPTPNPEQHPDFNEAYMMNGISPTPKPEQHPDFNEAYMMDGISPTPKPEQHTLSDNTIPMEQPIFLDENSLINVLNYSSSAAAQAIRDNPELYIVDGFRPNEEWVRTHTTDLSAFGNFVVTHDLNTNSTTAIDMASNKPLSNFNLNDLNTPDKAILQALNAPDTLFPSHEELMSLRGLSEMPQFERAVPFPNVDDLTPFSSSRNFIQVINTNENPFYAIVKITTIWPSGAKTHGSGFLINRNTVVTAGHVLYQPNFGGWPVHVSVAPGQDGINLPYGSISSSRFAVGGSWAANSNLDGDFGVMKLTIDSNVPRFFWMQARTNSQLNNLAITATGYPGGAIPQNSMQRSPGVITNTSQYRFDTTAYGESGISGAPIYDSFGWVVGITSTAIGGAGNIGAVKLDSGMINFFSSF